MKKNIVMILTNGFDPDPRVYKEAIYLVNKGFAVTVLCWDRDLSRNNPEDEFQDGIHVIRYKIPSVFGGGKKQIKAYLKYISRCKEYLRQNKPEYIHCNDLDGMVVGALAGKKPSRLVFDMHELYEDVGEGKNIKRKILRLITKHMIRRSHFSLYENDLYLRQPYASVKHKLVPLKNYPDSNLIIPKIKTDSSVFRIGYYGGLRTQIPQFTALFEAVKDLQDVEVLIRGGGPDLKELQTLSAQYSNVVVGGPFDGTKELTELYENTDIVYAGYRPDSATRECAEVVKFFECILTGTPIILTDVYTGMADRINNRGYGLTCDTLDVAQIRQAVIKLKDDVNFRRKCSENERRDAYLYDWNEAVKILDKVYR